MPIFGYFLLFSYFPYYFRCSMVTFLLLTFAVSALTVPCTVGWAFKPTPLCLHGTSISLSARPCVSLNLSPVLRLSPDSLIALLVYLQISQFASRLSIWHRPPVSQWSDKPADVICLLQRRQLVNPFILIHPHSHTDRCPSQPEPF